MTSAKRDSARRDLAAPTGETRTSRPPVPQPTAKIRPFELEAALARLREDRDSSIPGPVVGAEEVSPESSLAPVVTAEAAPVVAPVVAPASEPPPFTRPFNPAIFVLLAVGVAILVYAYVTSLR